MLSASTDVEVMDPQQAWAEMAERVMEFYDDPLGYVMWALPWGEPGTELEDQDGPDTWQRDTMNDLRDAIRAGFTDDEAVGAAIRLAVRSGHGIGKTALVSWLILWFMSTRPNPQCVITAGTGNQLSGKTWRELSKWQQMCVNGKWFQWTATKFYLKERPETWFATALPWNAQRPDSFAGTHEEHVLFIFDEASAIDDVIWEVVEGAMTTAGAMWIAFGNPVRNSGRFFECFHRFKHRWIGRKVDSRNAKMANQKQLQQWIDDYGEDSDFVRVRIKGEFPRSGSNQFISSEDARKCMEYLAVGYEKFAIRIGVDVARFGDDESVITVRQGRKRREVKTFRGLDTQQLAREVAQVANWYMQNETKPYIFVDGDGVGGGVVDALRAMGFDVIDVNSGIRADDPETYANKRAEMWGCMRADIKAGMELRHPDGSPDEELLADLTSIEYGFSQRNQIQLEKKADMKKRGLRSPDRADSLALTYAFPIADTGGVAEYISNARFKKVGGMKTTERWKTGGSGNVSTIRRRG